MLAYSFGQVMWTMLVFFAWVIFFWLLFIVFGDLFRRHDISGWGKAGWTIFVGNILAATAMLAYYFRRHRTLAHRLTAAWADDDN